METRTINQLATTATELESEDLIPIWQDGKTKKISGTNFFKNRSSTPVDVVEDGNLHAVTSNAVYDYVESKATPVDVVEDGNMHAVTSNAVYDYVSTELVYSATGIEVYRQLGTYTFQFRGCSLTDYQTAVSTVLNGQSLPHPWSAFVSRRNAANNDIFPGTVVVATDLYVTGWYSNGSGVESGMNMSDTLYGNATIVVTE